MIEAIEKIPIEILEAQLKADEEEGSKSNPKYIVVFLDDKFNINKIDEGTYSEICEKHKDLSDLQKKLIKRFNYYRGIEDFGKDFNRYSIGGNKALATCSLLHYDFSKKEGKISKNIFIKKSDENVKYLIENLNKKSKDYVLNKEFKDLKIIFEKVVINFFYNYLLSDNQKIDFRKYRIVLIPKDGGFLKKYNLYHSKFIKLKANKEDGKEKYVFPYDTFNSCQFRKLGILYSKFGRKSLTYQDEEINLIKKEEFKKLDLFKKIVKMRKILPLPSFRITKDSNIYEICFSKENSLLKKLNEIYNKNKKPFDYCLISNFEGYRFENIINYDFNTTPLINNKIYKLEFNRYLDKKEKRVKEYHSRNKEHNKFELLWDISFLFWKLDSEEKTEQKQMFFFNQEIKNNPYLNQILKENSESIINQIFKQDNTFINHRLQSITKRILQGIFKSKELLARYKNPHQIKKLLLTNLKYEKDTMKSDEIKRVQQKLSEFKGTQKLDEIESDFEAYVYAGLIVKHLLSKTSSTKSPLEIMTKYLISVNTVKQLKDKIIFLTSKYDHQLTVTPKMWAIINELVLENNFEDNKLKENLIPFFIGFYMDFWISKEKQEGLNNN